MATLQQAIELIYDLFANGFLALLGIAIAAPLVGVLLVLYRMPLLGLAAPQLATTGQAAVHFLFAAWWVADASHPERPSGTVQLVGALAFVMIGLAIIGACSRERQFLGVHAGIAFIAAIALQELFYLASPYEYVMEESAHHGQLLTVDAEGRNQVIACCVAALLICMTRWRRLWISAFDADQATILGMSPNRELVITLFVLGGFSAICAPVAGSLAVLTLLLVPPTFLRGATPSLSSLAPLSILAGVLGVLVGFVLACTEGIDWPPGTAVTVSVAGSSAVVALITRLVTRRRVRLQPST